MKSGQLLGGGNAEFLEAVLRSALAAPPGDPTAPRLAAEALIALADAGDDDTLSRCLFGPAASYAVRFLELGNLAPRESISALGPAEAIRCFAHSDLALTDDTVELVADLGADDERPVLVRRGGRPPRCVLRVEADEPSVDLTVAPSDASPPTESAAAIAAAVHDVTDRLASLLPTAEEIGTLTADQIQTELAEAIDLLGREVEVMARHLAGLETETSAMHQKLDQLLHALRSMVG